MMSTARSTTASLSDAKNRKTGFRCQAGREDGIGVAMTWGGYFPREPRCVQRESCRLLVIVIVIVIERQTDRSRAGARARLRSRGAATRFYPTPREKLADEQRRRSARRYRALSHPGKGC